MISPSSYSSTLVGALAGFGYTGTELQTLTDTLGIGFSVSVIGKSFATTDAGAKGGSGVGSGLGLLGIPPSSISSAMFQECTTKFGGGSELLNICIATEQASILEFSKANLTSIHSPISLGTGIINIGSISVPSSEWTGNIVQAGLSKSLAGPDFPSFAEAVGNSHSQAVSFLTGQVTITGGGGDAGVGVGSGTIS